VHNAKPCGTDTIKGVINWSSKSVKTFGHTFLKHGQNNFKKLQEVARQKNISQGIWKNDKEAAKLIEQNFNKLKVGENIIDLPKGLGQVIKPDGSVVEATKAIIIKNPDGSTNILTTAYPKIIP
jgi:hypothetical protein